MTSAQPNDERALRSPLKHDAAVGPAGELETQSHEELLRQAAARMPTFFRDLKLLGKRLTAEFAPQVSRIGEGQFRVMAVLYEDGELQVGDLAERCGVADPTVSKMLKSLESNGLVERTTDPENRRVVWVCLTPQGRALFDELSAAFERGIAQLLQGLTSTQLADVLRTIDHFEALVDSDERRAQGAACGGPQATAARQGESTAGAHDHTQSIQ